MINKRYYNTKRKRKSRRDAKVDLRKEHVDKKEVK